MLFLLFTVQGLCLFFLFVKILKIKAGYTRMYPPYKNAYKRPFWSFVQGGKMKKITLICACVLLFTAVNAEQMQFVTTMSAPVGNFAHLDAADSTHVTSAPILNFCNTRSSVGKIVIKGAGAYLKQIDIQNGTTLGSTNTPEYRLGANMSIENGGTVTAGRVMANDVTFEDTNFHKSNVTNAIYGNDVAVMGGKADNMDISGTAKINKSEQNSANLGEELWWDNQYASDYDASGNKKTNGKTYTSFLLKSKGIVEEEDERALCPETCPNGQHRTSEKYEDSNRCCAGYCRDICGGTGYSCPKINDSLNSESKTSGTNRDYWWQANWRAEPWEYYGDNIQSCYKCDTKQLQQSATANGWYDYKDEKGNVINPGLDASTCSVAHGCPAGYHESRPYICKKLNKFVPKEVHYKGAIGLGVGQIGVAEGKVYMFDGGNASIDKKGCWVWEGGHRVEIAMGSGYCKESGGPAAFCQRVCDPKKDTCPHMACLAEDSQDDMASIQAKQHTVYVDKKGQKVSDVCCSAATTNFLGGSYTSGCKQPKNKQTFSLHQYICVRDL